MNGTTRDSILSAGSTACFLIYLTVLPLHAQKNRTRANPIPMPSDRISDSFQIYSSLIPLGETADPRWSHEKWLVADSTVTTVPDEQPCFPVSIPENARKSPSSMDPHVAVQFPEKYRRDGEEALKDFDAHCHERWSLGGGDWSVKEPLLLLSPKEQNEFRFLRFRGNEGGLPPETIAKYKGAATLISFSGVFFSQNRTVAMVYATHWCGALCGEDFWTAFVLENGVWKQQRWTVIRGIS